MITTDCEVTTDHWKVSDRGGTSALFTQFGLDGTSIDIFTARFKRNNTDDWSGTTRGGAVHLSPHETSDDVVPRTSTARSSAAQSRHFAHWSMAVDSREDFGLNMPTGHRTQLGLLVWLPGKVVYVPA